jgi:flavin reductase (DIM6/NTAB) family NADH-FMN oxidoreductase RutF
MQTSHDPKDLRRAFSTFGTGVTVNTAKSSNGVAVGVTANSFNTVSLEPPIVLWSLSCNSPSLKTFREAGHFAVHVLTMEQINLSRQFSRASDDKFAGIATTSASSGAPLLPDCVATIECTTLSEQVVGDHILFLGSVTHYQYASKVPLLFLHGNYVQPTAIES